MHALTTTRSIRKPLLQGTAWLLLAIALWFLTAMASAQAQTQTQAPAKPAMPALFLEDTSPKALVPTVAAFREALTAGGWSVLDVTNMAGILSERGFTVHPVLVFDACSARYSADLLSRDETRFVASMIPCRVAIYQTSTGRVIISRMNSVAMAAMVGGHAGTIIRKSGEEMEQIIRATLRKLGS
ncbi:MAG: DUF302 domain-containing protein [Pseudomonadota bacterium]|jgi:uncharacterized protein (DUF302 family)